MLDKILTDANNVATAYMYIYTCEVEGRRNQSESQLAY